MIEAVHDWLLRNEHAPASQDKMDEFGKTLRAACLQEQRDLTDETLGFIQAEVGTRYTVIDEVFYKLEKLFLNNIQFPMEEFKRELFPQSEILA